MTLFVAVNAVFWLAVAAFVGASLWQDKQVTAPALAWIATGSGIALWGFALLIL